MGEGYELVIKPTNSSFLENSTHINFEKCEDILRREKNISLSRIITILQLEIFNTKEQSLVNQVEYAAYNDNKEILDLSVCKDTDIEIIHSISNDSYNLSDYNSFKNSGIDIFNIDDSFFKDICHPYSNSKNDVVLEDRIKYIYQNYSICDQGCSYNKIDFENKVISCICKVKANLSIEETSLNIKKFSEIKIESNFGLIKCYQLVFSLVGKLKNIGFFIFLILILIHIPLIIYYLSKGIQPIKSFLHKEMTKYGYALKNKTFKNINKKTNESTKEIKKLNAPPKIKKNKKTKLINSSINNVNLSDREIIDNFNNNKSILNINKFEKSKNSDTNNENSARNQILINNVILLNEKN